VEGRLLAGFGRGRKGETVISPCRETKARQMRHATPSAVFLWLLSFFKKKVTEKTLVTFF
jgi:hypothetical protein